MAQQLRCACNNCPSSPHRPSCPALPTDLLEGAAGGSDDDLGDGGLSGSEEEEEGSDEEGADLAGASLDDLDYDALLAAGAAQQRKRAAAAAASDSEEEEEEEAAAKRPKLSGRAAAERAKVEDEHFKLGEHCGRLRGAVHVSGSLQRGPNGNYTFSQCTSHPACAERVCRAGMRAALC